MLYYIILSIHVLVVLALIIIILVQRGRSGGLIEALGGVESIFGTKTNIFFVKITVVLAVLFFTTSVTLAYLSKQRSKSLVEKYQKEMPLKQDVEPLAQEQALPTSKPSTTDAPTQ
jgi:preprotein translocase subunit SecG